MEDIAGSMHRKCIIHVGIAKTGTSAIQTALHGYRDGSYLYANLDIANHSIPFMCMFAEDYLENNWLITREGWSRQKLQELRSSYRHKLHEQLLSTTEKTVIFSAENISRYSERSLMEMKDYLSSYFHEFNIIYYTREPLDWIRSVFQQRTQDYSGDIPFPLTKTYRLNPNHREQIERFVEIFGLDNVFVYKYEDAKNHTYGVVGHFLEKIGINNIQSIDTTKIINKSIGSEELRLVYIFNSMGLLSSGDKRLYLARMHLISLFKKIAVEQNPIPVEYYKDILEFKDKNWLEKHYGISYENYESENTGRLERALTELSEETSVRLKSVLETLRKTSHERMTDQENLQVLFLEVYNAIKVN